MYQKILISFVSDSDPIRGGYSGAFFEILRNFPSEESSFDKVFILLTNKYSSNEEKACVYRERLEKSIKVHEGNIHKKINYEFYATGINNPADYNEVEKYLNHFFKDVFRIDDHYQDSLYFNITSGTQQTNNNLIFYRKIYELYDIKLIQVMTPNWKIKDYYVNTYEVDEKTFNDELDVYDEFDKEWAKEKGKRCSEIHIEASKKNSLIEKINSSLDMYEYVYLKEIYGNDINYNKKAYALINHMIYRKRLKFEEAKNVLDSNQIDYKKYLKYYNSNNKDLQKVLEYFFVTKIAGNRNEMTDFLVRTCNLADKLIIPLIKKRFSIDVEKKYKINSKGYFDKDLFEMENDGFMEKYGFIYEKWNYRMSINYFKYLSDSNEEYNNLFDKLDNLHELRDKLAHNLESCGKEEVNKIIPIDTIISSFKRIICEIFGLNPNDDYFNVYDKINKDIKKELLIGV